MSLTRFANSVDVLKSVFQNRDAIKGVSALPDVYLKPTCSEAIMEITFWGSLTQFVEFLTPLRELNKRSERPLFTLSQCFEGFINLCKTMVMIIPMCPSWIPLVKNFAAEISEFLKS